VKLEAGETLLRPWRLADAGPLTRLADDRRIWAGLRDAFPHPYRITDARRFIRIARQHKPHTYFAIVEGGRLAGSIGYRVHADVERVGAEVGYWVAPEFWGRGIATTALRLLTEHAFERNPDLRRLYAVPFSSNPASARVLEKAGYTREGTLRQSAIKDGRILDQWMYSIVREELQGGRISLP
jgi:RimJ/RimL family protein N-acetyltransferase